MSEAEKSDGRFRGRMDFVSSIVKADDEKRLLYTLIEPDPRRYDLIELSDGPYYRDKFLHVAISKREMHENMVAQMPGLPMYHLAPNIESSRTYADERLEAVTREMETGEHTPPQQVAAKHQDFYERPDVRDVVFLSVDICGGTSLRKAEPTKFDRAYQIFTRELGTVVGQFNGSILKTTGDGFIAYIDFPGFTVQCDNAVDMGLTLLLVLRDSVNPSLAAAGLPELSIRVGADFGASTIRTVHIPATGYSSPEVASDAINRAVKIQESCENNEFRIGRSLYELVHVQWLMRAREAPFDGSLVGIPGYPAYRVT